MATGKDIRLVRINIDRDVELYAQILELRNAVLYKEVGFSVYEEDLSEEKNHITLAAVVSFAQCPVGSLILLPYDERSFRLSRMAVAPACQGQNIGRLLVEAAEETTRKSSRSRIYLHARSVSKGFYAKLGYSTISKEFVEHNIPHYEMEKEL